MLEEAHDWKDIYFSLERLFAKYRRLHEVELVGVQVLEHALSPTKSKDFVDKEVKTFRLPVDLDGDWPAFVKFREAYYTKSSAESFDEPADSVYQVAVSFRMMALREGIQKQENDYWFYRGQRDYRWDTVAKMFRGLGERAEADWQPTIDSKVKAVRNMASRLVQGGLAGNTFDAIAIIQHYSAELNLDTWLIDVTSSPWVGLFFATDGGRNGDIGCITLISRPEWERFSAHGASSLGALRVAEIRSVLRINHQQGFFLQAPHPELFNQLVNHKFYFRQHDGVVFECPFLDPPIDKRFIYPGQDDFLDRLRSLPPSAGELIPLDWEPSISSIGRPTCETYLPIASVLLKRCRDALTPELAAQTESLDWTFVLRELCILHAMVCSQRGFVPERVTTLHNLERMIGKTVAYGRNGTKSMLQEELFYHCSDQSTKMVIFRSMWEASHFWNQAAQNGLNGVWPTCGGQRI